MRRLNPPTSSANTANTARNIGLRVGIDTDVNDAVTRHAPVIAPVTYVRLDVGVPPQPLKPVNR